LVKRSVPREALIYGHLGQNQRGTPKKKRIRVPRERGDLNDLNLCGPMLGAKFHF